MAQRKVLFFQLNKRVNSLDRPNHGVKEDFLNIVNAISVRDKQTRQWDYSENKFCRLEEVDEVGQFAANVLFYSAKYKFRPSLLHRDTGEERENPKQLGEGEKIKTHLVARFIGQQVIFCLEVGSGTLQITQIISYLNFMMRRLSAVTEGDSELPHFFFGYEIIAKENFLQEVRSLQRVVEAQITVDKQILGSPALAFADRIEPVQQDLKIVVKAQRGLSMENAAVDLYNTLSGGSSPIRRIRVTGKNEQNNDVLIDTDLIAKVEFVPTEIHEDTGEVNTTSIFDQINAIAYRLT